jgi:hypothetical protein
MGKILFFAFFFISSCTAQKVFVKAYSLSFSIDDPNSFRSDFVSYKDCKMQILLLHKFDKKLDVSVDTINGTGGKNEKIVQDASRSYDTIGVLVVFKNDSIFCKFDKFNSDAVIVQKDNFSKNYPGMKYTMPVENKGQMISFKNPSAKDTVINDVLLRKVDSIVEVGGYKGLLSCYYVKQKGLLSVFNIHNQIKDVENAYCFAGYMFLFNEAKNQEGIIISQMKDVSKNELIICESLYQKAKAAGCKSL